MKKWTDHLQCQGFTQFDGVGKINLNVEGLEDVKQSGFGSDAHPVQVVQGKTGDHPKNVKYYEIKFIVIKKSENSYLSQLKVIG